MGKYVFPSFHVRSKLVHLSSNCWHCTNIILGQLANKSYSLCNADARIQGRYIKTAILQDVSRPTESGRTSTSQSLVQADASFFFAIFLIGKCKYNIQNGSAIQRICTAVIFVIHIKIFFVVAHVFCLA